MKFWSKWWSKGPKKPPKGKVRKRTSCQIKIYNKFLIISIISHFPPQPSPEPVYTPFKDKPYITCQYNHPTETLADVRRRAEDELLSKIKEITGSRVSYNI